MKTGKKNIDYIIGQLEGMKSAMEIASKSVVEVNREGAIGILKETIEFLEDAKQRDKRLK